MKILFVSGLYSTSLIEYLSNNSKGQIQNAPNVFQWNVVKGLIQNNANFDVVSLPFLPAFPMRYRKLFVPQDQIVYEGRRLGISLSFCNLAAYKSISVETVLTRYLRRWVNDNYSQDKLVILTYTPSPPFIKAIKNVKKQYPDKIIEVVSIVTDLVDDMMNYKVNHRPLKRIQCRIEMLETKSLYKHINKFILLSKHMTEKIPESVNSHIVIEGMISENKEYFCGCKRQERVILYTGTFQAFSGLQHLINAFHKVKDPNVRLVICGGGGALEDFVRQSTSIDDRIVYKGIVGREEAVQLQREATLLVNPRMPDGLITKYSFPSKTMEYMLSGTPMIGYKLEGIPEEYYRHYYTISSTSEHELVDVIEKLLRLPQNELNMMGQSAYDFVSKNKNTYVQVKSILKFLQE